MVEDVVRALGLLSLGTRMKRIGEALQAEAQTVLNDIEPAIPAGHHTLLFALERCGPLSIGELAEAMGIAQPGITRIVGNLVGIGLVEARQSDQDQRRRVVALTPFGADYVSATKAGPARAVTEIVVDLCEGLSGPLLTQLGQLEDNIADRRHRRSGRSKGEGNHDTSA